MIYLYENKLIKKNTMKKIVKLTETDLTRLVKKVIKEEYWKDYNEELEELESNLDMIQERLEGLTQIIYNDDNLQKDEKMQLIEYAESLFSLLIPLETLDSSDYPRKLRRD
jgi:hypothetical protein